MHKKLNENNDKMVLLDTVELHSIKDLPGQTEKHSHDFWELGYVFSGKGFYWNNDKISPITTGNLIISLPGEVHYEYCSSGDNVYILFLLFKNEFVPQRSFSLSFKTSSIINVVEKPAIKNIFLNILTETTEQNSDNENMIKAETTRLLIVLFRLLQGENTQKADQINFPDLLSARKLKIISGIKEYMENNLNRELNLEEIASKFYISLAHLNCVFKDTSAFSPKQYLNFLRQRSS